MLHFVVLKTRFKHYRDWGGEVQSLTRQGMGSWGCTDREKKGGGDVWGTRDKGSNVAGNQKGNEAK